MGSPEVNTRYELRGILGRGGMGIVYRAYDRVVGREVALKTMGDIQGRAAVEMFYKEWRSLANLHHPNIVEIFDIGEFDDNGAIKPYFVMPLLPGVTLDHLLRGPGGQLAPERLGEIVAQVCRGLQAIHDTGLIHRDIKPSNIFVMDFNSVKLIDFGIAHLTDDPTISGLKGTVSYIAPEQIENRECSPASDIFSLGVVVYEALCGVRPFQGAQSDEVFEAILRQNPAPIHEINPTISQTVSRVVHKALAKQPRHRYASALEFADLFQRALRGETISSLDPSHIQPRIQRAIRAFEQGNFQMAADILSDLEAAGHIDTALKPLRNQVDQALRRQTLQDLLNRARMALEEEELALALQNVQAALKAEPANEQAAELKERIQAEISRREVDDWLRSAQDSLDHFAFGKARQLLRDVMAIRPDDQTAAALFERLENRERAYRAERQEKEELYKGAREAWENSEFATAAAKLERVLELESTAPDTTSPNSGANYTNFLSLVRSAQIVIEKTRTDALAHMAAGRFERAAEVCRECIDKYPGHPVPQGLALMAEAQRQRQALTAMAEHIGRIAQETDLEKKLDRLRAATEAFPNEPLFEEWLRSERDRLGLVKALTAKAHAHEERTRFAEALEQWQMLDVIYGEAGGFEADIQRVAALTTRRPAVAVAAAAAAAGAGAGSGFTLSPPPVAPRFPTGPIPTATRTAAPVEPVPAAAPVPAPVEEVSTAAHSEPRPAAIQDAARLLRVYAARAGTAVEHYSGVAWRLFHKGSWTAYAALSALILIGAAMTYTALRPKQPKANVAAPPPRAVRVLLRGGTQGASIRVGDGAPASEFDAQLAPGTYPVTVEREGFEPYHGAITVPPGGLVFTIPALQPSPTMLHINSDLQKGRIRLDDRAEAGLEDSAFQTDAIEPGTHAITVSEGSREVHLEFVTAAGKAPVLQGPVRSKDLATFAFTGFGRSVEVQSGVPQAKITVDNLAGTSTGEDKSAFADLNPGPHEVVAAAGGQERRFILVTAARPTLWVELYSDRNVGTLVVQTGLRRFQVFLDGVAYTRKIQDGVMRIADLAPKQYTLRVVAEGFEAAPERTIDVKKGTNTASVTLAPVPEVATLAIRGVPPRTQVLVDGAVVGIAGDDGSVAGGRVPPGEHKLELRPGPQFKAWQTTRSFAPRETVTLTASDIRFERSPSEIAITAVPEGSVLEVRCGQNATERNTAPTSVTCSEPRITITASSPGYERETQAVSLNPGESVPVHFSLKKTASAPVKKVMCTTADLAGHGWTADHGWYVSSAGATLPCGDALGEYQFSVRLPTGVFTARSVWTVQGASGSHEFTLEKKSFAARGGTKFNIGGVDAGGALTFLVRVEADRFVHLIRANQAWKEAASEKGNYHPNKIIFAKDVWIANFSFTEQ